MTIIEKFQVHFGIVVLMSHIYIIRRFIHLQPQLIIYLLIYRGVDFFFLEQSRLEKNQHKL